MEKKGNLAEKNPVEEPLASDFKNTNSSIFTKNLLIFIIVAIIMGAMSGYILSGKGSVTTNTINTTNIDPSKISKGTVVGSDDTKTFKDTATGSLKGGGINGEGQFHLSRPGGDSQNVYLTSSNLDLSKFVGKKVKVWGQTQKAQYAGWLMDVGRVEIVE